MVSNKYKTLIRHEFKALKWMMLYFMILFVGYLVLIGRVMANYRIWFLTDTNIFQVNNMMGYAINAKYGWLMLFMTIGMLILVYLQFHEYKSHDVGRFLNVLPIQGVKVYLIKIGCGIVSYTVPFLVLVGGIVWIRTLHGDWLQDLYQFTLYSKQFLEVESVGAIVGVFGIYYLIGLMVYVVLVMVQYFVNHPVFALVVGLLITTIPFYIMNGLAGFWGKNVTDTLWIPLSYGYLDRGYGYSVEMGEHVSLTWLGLSGTKVVILIVSISLALVIGYRSTKKLRIENQSRLMPSICVRQIFIIVGTVCIGLLPMVFRALLWCYPLGLVGMVITTGISLGLGHIVCQMIAKVGSSVAKEECK